MTVGERIKARRKALGLSADALAELVGVNRATVYRYEGDEIKNMGTETLVPLAKALRTTPAWLMGWDGDEEGHRQKSQPSPFSYISPAQGVRIPVFASVPAGIPLEAIEEVIDYEEIPQSMAAGGEYFGLRVKGDSMLPDLRDGDVVIVRRQESVDSGEIAIILVNGSEATVKRVLKHGGGITLVPSNSVYEPMNYSNIDIRTLPVRIAGKVVEVRRRL